LDRQRKDKVLKPIVLEAELFLDALACEIHAIAAFAASWEIDPGLRWVKATGDGTWLIERIQLELLNLKESRD
jgi:hypothetical protein